MIGFPRRSHIYVYLWRFGRAASRLLNALTGGSDGTLFSARCHVSSHPILEIIAAALNWLDPGHTRAAFLEDITRRRNGPLL